MLSILLFAFIFLLFYSKITPSIDSCGWLHVVTIYIVQLDLVVCITLLWMTWMTLVDTWCNRVTVALCKLCLPQQTFTKCPSSWQCEHAWLYTGHFLWLPVLFLAPHPEHFTVMNWLNLIWCLWPAPGNHNCSYLLLN